MTLSNIEYKKDSVSWQLNELFEAGKRAKYFADSTNSGLATDQKLFEKTSWQTVEDIDALLREPPKTLVVTDVQLESDVMLQGEFIDSNDSDVDLDGVEETSLDQIQTENLRKESKEQLFIETDNDDEVEQDNHVRRLEDEQSELEQVSISNDRYQEGFDAGMQQANEAFQNDLSFFKALFAEIDTKLNDMPPLWAQLSDLMLSLSYSLVKQHFTLHKEAMVNFFQTVLNDAGVNDHVPLILEVNPDVLVWFESNDLRIEHEGKLILREDASLSVGDIRLKYDDAIIEKILSRDLDALREQIILMVTN